MDLFGDKFEAITGGTGTANSKTYQAIKILGGSATVTLTPLLGDVSTLTTIEVASGDVVTLRSGWSSVAKTAGDGVVLCYFFE